MTAEDFKLSLQAGAVYYFSDQAIRSTEPHYCIVLNKDPRNEVFLVLVPATTLDIWSANAASKFPEQTIVSVTVQDCSFLNRPSLFDCNRPITKHIDIISGKAVASALKIKGIASPEIIEKLRTGVLASKLVTEKVKKILR